MTTAIQKIATPVWVKTATAMSMFDIGASDLAELGQSEKVERRRRGRLWYYRVASLEDYFDALPDASDDEVVDADEAA